MATTDDPYLTFLADLKALRLERGLTQAELAQKVKLSRAQFTAIENGRCLINFVHLHNLAVALGVQWTIGPASAR